MFHYILGYALRKHIAESLQKRSAAIRTALDHYNAAAKALRPPPSPSRHSKMGQRR